MTDAGYDFDRFVADQYKSGSIWRFGSVSWIPAFTRMTAEAGMLTKGTPTRRVIRQNPAAINRPGPVSWIPAFSGMTEGLKSGICQE